MGGAFASRNRRAGERSDLPRRERAGVALRPAGGPRAAGLIGRRCTGTEAERDETLVKALVRAHRWRRRIESGQDKSVTDLAEQEDVTDAYVCRLLPLTCLAPEIVEVRLAARLGNGPMVWEEQRASWDFCRAFRQSGPSGERGRAAAG
jgi:hypothetical protein